MVPLKVTQKKPFTFFRCWTIRGLSHYERTPVPVKKNYETRIGETRDILLCVYIKFLVKDIEL